MCYDYDSLSNNNTNLSILQEGNIYVSNVSNFTAILSDIILPQYVPKEGNSLTIHKDDEVVYQVTNSKNEIELLKNLSNKAQNVSNNISIIDLGECEEILRKAYHINENDSLIFIKNEQQSGKASQKNIQYEVYEPYNRIKLNLSLCDEAPVKIYIPVELNEETEQIYEQMKESGYDMFDINDSFYQDICTPFDSQNGTDILLSDRIDYIYNNENTKCQSNCHLSNYSKESEYLVCTC